LVERDLPKVDVASSNLVIRSMSLQGSFQGFPEAALDFYDDLEMDNTKSFWQSHKHVYDDAIRVFRPYRDVRFAKDKTPYKTAQGAFVSVGPATGWYVEIGAPGVRVGGGYYHAGGPDLSRIRTAIDTEHSGEELERLVTDLQAAGFEIRGEQLKTTPRGYPADHPRIELLRYKSMALGRSYGFEKVIHGPELLDQVRDDWRALRPLVEWVRERVDVLG
jgi:uncharacterized protein (TIGR02453 family)